jgi:hypothetical protein
MLSLSKRDLVTLSLAKRGPVTLSLSKRALSRVLTPAEN